MLRGLDSAKYVRGYLDTHFSKKYRISNISVEGTRVLLIAPSFKAMSDFGTIFAKLLDDTLKKIENYDTKFITISSKGK